MTRKLRVFIIAGEPSGDQLGGHLMAGLERLAGPVNFAGVGGPAMEAQGLASLFAMNELSVMGLTEVLPKLPGLLRRVRETATAAEDFAPDVLITIDSPDFCLRVAKRVKAAMPKLPVVHYVAPSVWAWRPKRATKMARHVDHVLALLPFEPPYMERAGMSCDFVGHPVTAQPVIGAQEAREFRATHQIDTTAKLLCVLPGSRGGEVARHAPLFSQIIAEIQRKHKDLRVVIPAAAHVAPAVQEQFASLPGRVIVLDPRDMPPAAAERRKLAAFAACDSALAASGTVSLELARQGTPMVIGYLLSALSEMIVRRLYLANSVTLVNLISQTLAIPEHLGRDCRKEPIIASIEEMLAGGPALEAQRAAMSLTMDRLKTQKDAAAQSVINFLANRKN